MNEKEPYIYTMPERFMLDDSVPSWWRLLGILNGFWLNHLPFYASNEWIMKRLRCSEPTATAAIQKLEEMNLISCIRKGNERTIVSTAHPNQFGSSPKSTWVAHPNQFGHNSDSNSESIIPPARAGNEEFTRIPTDSEGNPIRKKEHHEVAHLIELFEPLNPSFKQLLLRKVERGAADRLLALHNIEYWMDFIPAYTAALQKDRFCPKATTPLKFEQRLGEIEAYAKQLTQPIKSKRMII